MVAQMNGMSADAASSGSVPGYFNTSRGPPASSPILQVGRLSDSWKATEEAKRS